MKNKNDSTKNAQQSTIIDFINDLTEKRQRVKKTSNIIRLHSSRVASNTKTSSNRNLINSAIDYARKLDW